MPNVTISVSEELKIEMDALSEVNWSEICRNAVSQYIAQRKNPTPQIELDISNCRITSHDYETGYPTITADLRIHNTMSSEIMIDRILCKLVFLEENSVFTIGNAYYLHRKWIPANSAGGATIRFVLPKEKIVELKDRFQSTFTFQIRCSVLVENFKNEFNQEVQGNIPIDQWNNVVKEALKLPQGTYK